MASRTTGGQIHSNNTKGYMMTPLPDKMSPNVGHSGGFLRECSAQTHMTQRPVVGHAARRTGETGCAAVRTDQRQSHSMPSNRPNKSLGAAAPARRVPCKVPSSLDPPHFPANGETTRDAAAQALHKALSPLQPHWEVGFCNVHRQGYQSSVWLCILKFFC